MNNLYNAVICLSHELTSENKLSTESKKRLKKSVEIYNAINSDYLITTGWRYKRDLKSALSNYMAEFAFKNLKIPKKNIIQVPHAKDTVGEALFLKLKLIDMNLKLDNLYVVTSDWHLSRTKEIFSFIFGAKNDPSLNFKYIRGHKKYANKEELNNSIFAFRKISDEMDNEDIIALKNKILTDHNLYNK